MRLQHTLPRVAFLLGSLAAFVLAASQPWLALAQDTWEVGRIVGLHEGTCIRTGPGSSFRAHTRVPEDDWAVMVIDGPRRAEGKEWFDTSREAAGDPSGGTGWVDRSQTDICPADSPAPPPNRGEGDPIKRLRDWWRAQTALVKWLVAVVVMAVVISSWRALSATAFRMLGFFISGIILYLLANVTRHYWQPTWSSWLGQDAPDLALLVALVPVVSWLVGKLRSGMRR